MPEPSNPARTSLYRFACVVSLLACSTSDSASPARPAAEPACSPGTGTPDVPEAGAPVTLAPTRLKSYAEIKEAVLSGARVRISVNYKICSKDGGAGVDASSTTDLDSFEVKTPAGGPSSIESSKSNLAWIFRDGYEYLWNYGKIRFGEDGTASVRAQYYKPNTFTQSLDEEFTCGLDTDGKGAPKTGMSVFREPAAPRRLQTFAELMTTLNGGGYAHALVDLAKCQKLVDKKPAGPGPNIVENIPFGLNEYFGKMVVGNPAAFVATSHAGLDLLPDGIANRYAKLRVTATDEASVLIMTNKPAGLELIESAEYSCPLATTATGGGVSLFGF